jgi:hypothetical protein
MFLQVDPKLVHLVIKQPVDQFLLLPHAPHELVPLRVVSRRRRSGVRGGGIQVSVNVVRQYQITQLEGGVLVFCGVLISIGHDSFGANCN